MTTTNLILNFIFITNFVIIIFIFIKITTRISTVDRYSTDFIKRINDEMFDIKQHLRKKEDEENELLWLKKNNLKKGKLIKDRYLIRSVFLNRGCRGGLMVLFLDIKNDTSSTIGGDDFLSMIGK